MHHAGSGVTAAAAAEGHSVHESAPVTVTVPVPIVSANVAETVFDVGMGDVC